MCGIAGCLNFDADRPVHEPMLRAMTAVIAHRGPDGEGFHIDGPLGLGHRRLAVIDVAGGAQPLCNESRTVWIVANGEIYNHFELRRDLLERHCFRSHSDSEVILHLYEEHGADCLKYLNGMFAFALWDKRARTLLVARDRLGIKPLYWTVADGALLFASEIKALLASGRIRAAMNAERLSEYLTFQFLLGDATLFEGIYRLEPGCFLTVRPGDRDAKVQRYWDFKYDIDTDADYDSCKSRVSLLLKDSVALRLRSDVPVGAYLSGGLDSSVIVSLAAARRGSSLPVFTGAFDAGPQFDETRYARDVAAACGAVYHEVRPTAEDFCRDMQTIVYLMDEPAAGPGAFPQYHASRLAAQHVKVCLGGQGGDELFGGYARYLAAYLEQCIKGAIHGGGQGGQFVVTWEEIAPNLPLLREYTQLLQSFWAGGLFDDMSMRYLSLVDRSRGMERVLSRDVWNNDAREPVVGRFDAQFRAPEAPSYFVRMTHFDLTTLLPALLHVEDRMSMGVSLETRVPLLDHRVVECVTRLPPVMRFRGACSKRVLRDVAAGIVPDGVLNRRDKMGFPVPLDDWMQREPVRSFVRDTLLSSTARSRGLFNPAGLEAALNGSAKFSRLVWGLLNLELWFKTFIDQSALPAAPPAAYSVTAADRAVRAS